MIGSLRIYSKHLSTVLLDVEALLSGLPTRKDPIRGQTVFVPNLCRRLYRKPPFLDIMESSLLDRVIKKLLREPFECGFLKGSKPILLFLIPMEDGGISFLEGLTKDMDSGTCFDE